MDKPKEKKKRIRKPKISIECKDEAERQRYFTAAKENLFETLRDFVRFRCLGVKPKKTPLHILAKGFEELRRFNDNVEKYATEDLKLEALRATLSMSEITINEYNEHKGKSA